MWDRHYHVTLLSDLYLRNLLAELDLDRRSRAGSRPATGFFNDGKLHSMSNTLEFLRFPPLGLIGKLRLGWTIFYASRLKDWKRLERVTVAEWLEKLSGKRTFEKIWLPLLRAKLGESYRETSAAFIWTTIARMYAARRSGLKKEMFGYVEGGYARVLDHFAEVLLNPKAWKCAPGVRVTRAERNDPHGGVSSGVRRRTPQPAACGPRDRDAGFAAGRSDSCRGLNPSKRVSCNA